MATSFEVVVATPFGSKAVHKYPNDRQAAIALGKFRGAGFTADAFEVRRTLMMPEQRGAECVLVPFDLGVVLTREAV